MRYTIIIESMHCETCAANIERYLQNQPGVEAAGVDYNSEEGWLEVADETELESLITAIEAMGYTASVQK